MQHVVNVLMHGVFGYVLRQHCVDIYTPAVHGHIYVVGGKISDRDQLMPLCRTGYSLGGVEPDSLNHFALDERTHPMVKMSAPILMDPFKNCYCKFRFPYPKAIPSYTSQLYPVDAYNVGSIFAGHDSAFLNKLDGCPSMLIIVYSRSDSPLRLEADDGSCAIDLSKIQEDPSSHITNLHFWCTRVPTELMDPAMATRHVRKAFSALMDLVPHGEVILQVPDGFSPTSCPKSAPPGVEACDIDPGSPDCKNREHILFGKVNCHYSTVMLVPSDYLGRITRGYQ